MASAGAPHGGKSKKVDLDNIDVDFTAVENEKKGSEVIAQLLQQSSRSAAPPTEGGSNRVEADASKAFDPVLQGYMQKQQRIQSTRRRKGLFAASAPSPTPTAAKDHTGKGSETQADGAAAASFWAEHVPLTAAVAEQKRTQYLESLRSHCCCAKATTEGDAAPPLNDRYSLLSQLFADGVPDVEPWDAWAYALPRYEPRAMTVNPSTYRPPSATAGTSTSASAVAKPEAVHLSVLPALADSFYMRECLYNSDTDPHAHNTFRHMKTKKELREERRERQKAKQAEAKRQREEEKKKSLVSAITTSDGNNNNNNSSSTAAVKDRLSYKRLALHITPDSILNSIQAEMDVRDAYRERFLAHLTRNHERHVAAIPNQIARRERLVARRATERPLLRVYRVFPIYSPAHLARLRHYANDSKLRGFVLWCGGAEAAIVLTGGEVALRHLDTWILDKMTWESRDTRAERLCSVQLPSATCFSFHQHGKKRARTEAEPEREAEDAAEQPVYMNFVTSPAEAEAFLVGILKDSGAPWADLSAVWRSVFIATAVSSS